MTRPRPLAAVAAALALGLSGAAAAGASPASPVAPVPAPPPAMYCHAPPAGDWPAIGSGPVADLTALQDYRAGLAITPPDATGDGVTIGDVEYEWSSTHADLAPRGVPAAPATGLAVLYPQVRDHGTAVLGVLGAADDGRGVTGLAPEAALKPVSPMMPPLMSYQPAVAITNAAKDLGPGDVLLIEQQAQISPGVYGPIEYFDSADHPVRTAIAKAVARGVTVVEPAGNGDLDIGTLAAAPWLSGASDRASGALIVGAGGAGIGESDVPDRQRVPGSNWGARVDVQGFGSGVISTGYGDISDQGAGADHAYTACFDGTSSASATVAGAVAALQSAVTARRGTPLSPDEVRSVLRATGLPQVATPGATLQNIGPRPQVAAALARVIAAGPPPDGTPSPDTGSPSGGPAPPPTPAPPGGAGASTGAGAALAPAASGLTARFDRAHRRLTVRLRGVARAATVRVGPRLVRVRNGVVVLRGVRPGRIVVRVAAGGRYAAVTYRVLIPVRGAPRVERLR